MQAYLIAFTADGIITNDPIQFCGIGFSGFTAVDIYDGTDTTGTLVAHVTQTTDVSSPIICNNGLYVDVTGTGKGSVWVR